MKFSIITVLVLSSMLVSWKNKEKTPDYKNPRLSIEERVDDLISRMTVEEKVFQLCALRLGDGDEIFKTSGEYSADYIRDQMKTHGVGHISCPTTDMFAIQGVKTANEIQKIAVEETRLGIPTLINDEALHGCKAKGSTSYPQAIALSCTWDLELMKRIGDAIGKETYSRGIRQVLSPNLDLARDPRHGRMEETYGEDPILAAKFGVEFIKAVQGQGVICSPKHFVANFVADGGRDAGNIELSERSLREIHFVPYKAAVKEADVQSIMAAYNAVNGVPCTSNKWLLNDILRDEWGFTGFTVSDWSGVNHIHGTHKAAKSYAEAAKLSVKAGMDVDLPRLKSYFKLIELINKGEMTEKDIEPNVRRVLTAKFKLGLFENPYVDEKKVMQDPPEYRKLALEAARKSIVLLKNGNNILPLNPLTVKKIGVFGPNANRLELGGYSASRVKGPTPLDGIKAAFGDNVNISYVEGCNHTSKDKKQFSKVEELAKQCDVNIIVVGGHWGWTGGEGADRLDLNLMGVQEDLIDLVSKAGKPVIVVINDGRPVITAPWIDKVDAVLMAFFAGEEGGTAMGEIIAGKVNPSGKLTVTFPRHSGQVPMNLIHKPHGREGRVIGLPEMDTHYRYYPQFQFGFGLSYTTFEYSNLIYSSDKIKNGDNLSLKVDVKNTGEMAGDEIVQVYLTDLYCRITRSAKELRAFERISLEPGETKTVEFTITAKDMSFLNEELKPEVEPGEFELLVGQNCFEGLTKQFVVQ